MSDAKTLELLLMAIRMQIILKRIVYGKSDRATRDDSIRQQKKIRLLSHSFTKPYRKNNCFKLQSTKPQKPYWKCLVKTRHIGKRKSPTSQDFKKCALEQAIYTRTERDSILLVGVYVDDLIITGTPKREIDKFKDQMKEIFEMSDLGLLAYYLGIEVTQSGGDISIKQSAYARKILKEAGMLESNETIIPMDPGTRLMKTAEGTMVNSTEYRSLIGCLRYLLHTRPDLSYSVGLLSRFMQEPREQHMKAIRQVLRYVKGTKDYGITYRHNGGNKIHGFSDSSYGVNTQEGKGTTGIIFYYVTAAATQALWLKRLLSTLTHSQEEKVTIQVDNKYAITLINNPIFHGRSKHIDTKYHFIRECVEREDIQVEFVSGEYQKADILTKALPKIKFLTMRQLIGLKDLRHSVCD
ncbi:ribonuclease H-like domain, reverse transcriptase, RNA-dependent DNA polymerase [Tanacetum coccineum]